MKMINVDKREKAEKLQKATATRGARSKEKGFTYITETSWKHTVRVVDYFGSTTREPKV